MFLLRKFQQPVVLNVDFKFLSELKSKPHRVFLAGAVSEQGFIGDLFSTEVEDGDQTLWFNQTKERFMKPILQDLNLSERTSNGSFISDTISDEEVFDAYLKEVFTKKIKKIKNQSSDWFFLLKKFSENYK